MTILVTLTITMPLNHWKQLRSQLNDMWPGYDLRRAINDAVQKLEGQVTGGAEP